MDEQLKRLVNQAVSGDKVALESVVVEIRDMVYNLSLKVLFFPDDAQDATQEILIKVITHLSTFEGNSQFKTWVLKTSGNNYPGRGKR